MSDDRSLEKDLEASKQAGYTAEEPVSTGTGSIDEIRRTHEIINSCTPLRKLHEAERWVDRKLGGDQFFETQGIDRIPDEEKTPPSIWNSMMMWSSVVMHVGTIPLGVLGAEYGLSFSGAMVSATVGILTGALLPAWTGTLGPQLGLRQIATSRYSFGFWGAKLCSVLNVLVGGGFAVVNAVVVGQILSAVSDYNMTIAVGCVIIAVVSYVLSVFGFRLIHTFEKYSWLAAFILFVVLFAQATPHCYPLSTPGFDTGIELSGAWLSFMALQFSSASGWCSMAADYYCNYPKDTSKVKIFLLTWIGIIVPTLFTTYLGIILGQAATLNEYPPYADAYTNHGLGGLLLTAWHPVGWAKFAAVISIFTVCGNNIAINYSSGLSLQLLGNYFHAIPRFIWSFLVALVVAILAIAGSQHLSTIVSNFVSMLGYWTVSFTIILMMEHYVFRHRYDYDLPAWDQPSRLPIGAAAVFSLVAAYCGGGVPGMAQVWYVGPIAAKFGPYGGDVGIFLSGAITALVYPITRYLEKKYTGR
jgi:NCS1 nucleoside transporter family